MGAGKTTVGRLLAELLHCCFIDLDEQIVLREQRSISDIFAEDGEGYFRDCEAAALASLQNEPPTVYATGGGLVMRAENRQTMRALGTIVYLRCPWPVLQRRLQQGSGRPLASPDKGWDEIEALWKSRLDCYADADLIVDTAGLTPLQTAWRVAAGLTERVLP